MTITPDPEQSPPLFETATFRAFCAALDIDTHVAINADGRSRVRLDREGLEKLRDTASAHGAITIAAAIDIALAERLDDGGLS